MTTEQSAIRHGSKIGRFVVVAELGSGGMGVVYAAHDRELDRQVALKVMRGVTDDDEDRKRMLREGQAMARVTHPNVITVYEVGTHQDTTVFLAQELLDGGTLGKWLQAAHTRDEILEKFVAAGRGLAAAHAAGLVHRDFKPDNVLLGKDGRVRVADFGLARSIGTFADPAALVATAPGGGAPRGDDVAVTRSALDNLTRTGAVMGTPMFMAPEQHEGRRADERSDQFAFCVALYHALHGDWPYEGKTSVALADNVINNVRKPPPKTANVPARLRKIIDRGLATAAEERYSSMDALLADLTFRPRARWPVVAAAGVLLAGAGTAAVVLTREQIKLQPALVRPTPVVVDEQLDPAVLVEAIDKDNVTATRRQLAGAAARLRDRSQAAIARACVAFLGVLAGDLSDAEEVLKDAEARAKELAQRDPRVRGYIDLAGAAIASARGELATAKDKSGRCAAALAGSDPLAASMCFQLLGETAIEMGDSDAAGKAFAGGLQLAERANSAVRGAHLALAKLQLEFEEHRDAYQTDPALAQQRIKEIDAQQSQAHKSKAASCEAGAAALAARMRIAVSADRQNALDVFGSIAPDSLESYRLKTLARIVRGEVLGDEGDPDGGATGIDYIDDAIDDAKRRGFWGLVLEARLARVRVLLPLERAGAEAEQQDLVAEATAKGFKRIARLAETAAR